MVAYGSQYLRVAQISSVEVPEVCSRQMNGDALVSYIDSITPAQDTILRVAMKTFA